MTDRASPNQTCPVAVIMERIELANRWASEKWETKGIVQHAGEPGAAPSIIVQSAGVTHMLFPGHRLELRRDEAEGYYLNLTSPEPKVFVMWRFVDEVAKPQRITVSYGEGLRWADSGEQVDGVQVPPDLLPWIASFVEAHYQPEPPKARRYASSRDNGRMGRVE